jgi:hypothetical protein
VPDESRGAEVCDLASPADDLGKAAGAVAMHMSAVWETRGKACVFFVLVCAPPIPYHLDDF